MEAGRPVILNPSVLEGVVSLLVTFVLIYPSLLRLRVEGTFEQRWALPKPVLPRAFGRVEGSRNRLRAVESCDYTYLYNLSLVSSLDKIWQRQRFSMSPGWTLSSWLRGRFRGQNPILQRRSSGRVFRGSSSIRLSTVFSTMWRSPTSSFSTRSRSYGLFLALRTCYNCSRAVSAAA